MLHWLRQWSRRLIVGEGRSSGGLGRRTGDSEVCSDCSLGSLEQLESGGGGRGGSLLIRSRSGGLELRGVWGD